MAPPKYNLNIFFTQFENSTKIQNFNYSNSIINKIYTSKYITSPESKISFIFQYACFLELYFSKQFLSSVRSELVMGEELIAKQIKIYDINSDLIDIASPYTRQENSFESHSFNSRNVSSQKFYVSNQFSMNTFSKLD